MSAAFVWLVVRLRWLVVAGWVAAAVAATVYLPGLAGSDEAALGGLVPAGAESVRTEERSVELFRAPLVARAVVVQRNPNGLSGSEQRSVVTRALAVSRGRDPLFRTVALAVPVLNTGGLVPASRERGTTSVTYLFFDPDATLGARSALAASYGVRLAARPGTFVGATGAAPARLEQWHAIEDALPLVELATVLLIALVVGVTFRSVAAPLVALAAAAISFLVALGLVGWVGTALGIAVPREVEPVMLVLLLGVVTDYAVFYLAATRRRLAAGENRVGAAERAARENTPIIVTTGLIVTFGTAALLVGRLEFFRAFGPGAAVTVLVALAVSTTFVPALLAIGGRRVFWPSVMRPSLEERVRDEPRLLLRVLTTRPAALVVAAGAVAVLVVAASWLPRTNLGFTLLTGLPEGSTSERALFEAGKGFAPGIVAPTEVLVEGDGVGSRRDALATLQRLLAEQRGVAGVIGPAQVPPQVDEAVFTRPDAVRLAVILSSDPLGGAAIDRVEELQRRLPSLLEQAGLGDADAALAGDTAVATDTVASIVGDIWRIALAALLVNFVFLALFLRAVVAPLYLLVASALGLAAALGVTTFVFRELLGYGDVTYYVPFAAAVLLLSLGSDYNLLVVGRIWRAAEEGPLRDAVMREAPRASRAITVAAVALAGSFALLALVPLRPFREFALAMAAGVLLDAFLVRTLLVPALISLVGEQSRWPARRLAPARRG